MRAPRAAGEAGSEGGPSAPHTSFQADIRPLMNRVPQDPNGGVCKGCHYSTESRHDGLDQSGVDLATLGSLRRGGKTSSGTIAIAGNPDLSAIAQKLEGTYPTGARMPHELPRWRTEDIAIVRAWISEGAQGGDEE